MKKKILLLAGTAVMLAGCHTDMWTQAKVTDYDEDTSGIFADGTTARPLVPGTVAQGWAKLDDAHFTGMEGTRFTSKFPTKLTLDGEEVDTTKSLAKVLSRGKERFTINCSHCHGAAGDGEGMITQRGLVLRRKPATYHTDRLRKMPVGYFYDVISNGYGVMFSQQSRVLPDDRWAIVAYIRALQLSQNANSADLTSEDMTKIQESQNAPAEGAAHEGGH